MDRGSKTILVTGATGGIGVAVSQRLAKAGYSLLLSARNTAKLQALSDELSPIGGGSVRWIAADMADDLSVDAFAAELERRAIALDGAVLMPPQAARTNDPLPPSAVWRDLFQGSFIGPLALLKAAIGRMNPRPEEGKRAKIVIISGISSAQVLGHYATSNVLRTAWLGEAKTLAFALGERGIHVNTLSLGGTLTPDYSASIDSRAAASGVTREAKLAEETANIPLRKYGRPEEVAAAVEGLLCELSDHMTGVNLLHDGGFTRAY
jgi:3-oxoacyl-[acyl-carrier protein] reductase